MGVTDYDYLPQNLPLTRLKEARQTAFERKGSSQRVAGANLLYYRTDNAGEFAWSGQASIQSPQSPGTGGAFFVVALEADIEIFLSDLVLDLYKSTDSGSTWSPVTDGSASYTLEPTAPVVITPFESRYFVSVTAALNAYLAFKLQALATNPVTMTVTERSI